VRSRDRYRLYRAKVFGPDLTSADQLRRLQRDAERAEGILESAKSASQRP